MKKIIAIGSLLLLLVLVACSEGERTTSTEKKSTTITENKKKNTEKEKNVKEARVEVIQETFGTWKDANDIVWVNYSAEVKNKGKAPASFSNIVIHFQDKKKNDLKTVEMVIATPDVLMPEEVGYITESTKIDAVKNEKMIKKAYAKIEYKTGKETPYYLKTEKVLLKDNKQKFREDQPYIVTGIVTNAGKGKGNDIRVAAGLYDEKGKLVAVLQKSIGVSLKSGGKTTFQLDFPSISPAIKGKVKTVKVVSYNWKMGM